jgi:hypothetical protein
LRSRRKPTENLLAYWIFSLIIAASLTQAGPHDKGVITVVEDGGGVITTWNRDQLMSRPPAMTLFRGAKAYQ